MDMMYDNREILVIFYVLIPGLTALTYIYVNYTNLCMLDKRDMLFKYPHLEEELIVQAVVGFKDYERSHQYHNHFDSRLFGFDVDTDCSSSDDDDEVLISGKTRLKNPLLSSSSEEEEGIADES